MRKRAARRRRAAGQVWRPAPGSTPGGPSGRALRSLPEGPGSSARTLSLALVIAVLALAVACGGSAVGDSATPAVEAGDAALARAFEDRASGVPVQGEGRVTRLLPDDDEGARHQRFILRLASGQTVLVAHNVDVAPRLDGLAVGDGVAFRGEYEWNAQGGVVHWTHHDPSGEHAAGWLRWGGRTVQ